MQSPEISQQFIAWWGAGLSSFLAAIKVWELWIARTRIEVSYNFTTDGVIGNRILIRNLTSRPIILAHWELQRANGNWPFRSYRAIDRSEHDDGDSRIEAHSTLNLSFTEKRHFSWSGDSRIYLILHIAGHMKRRLLVYPK